MIEGVVVQPLPQILDERGKIMHFLKRTDPWFREFGEVYFSTVYPGVVKAWHQHTRLTLNYVVPVGNIKFVLFDARPGSATEGTVQELFLGADNYCLVLVPPLIWNGFKGIGVHTALVANCATEEHDPNEIVRLDPKENGIPYQWDLIHR